jgi:hypothetical protein
MMNRIFWIKWWKNLHVAKLKLQLGAKVLEQVTVWNLQSKSKLASMETKAGSIGQEGGWRIWSCVKSAQIKNMWLWEERRCWVLDIYFWQFAWLWHVSVLFGSLLGVAFFWNYSKLVFIFCCVDGGSRVVVKNYVECLVFLMESGSDLLVCSRNLFHCLCMLM